ncbi:hypothetical protein Hypma_007123 [Hypsizygus marmoreus]|uniref:Uncharacterized protein n=1 Tax=Hypsizygus marmoreus TaxID=39966 RepID=A0A369K797_HYPMA|nr:hypothetical protein Hypma_007123 [Hypsizygus marmoreus]
MFTRPFASFFHASEAYEMLHLITYYPFHFICSSSAFATYHLSTVFADPPSLLAPPRFDFSSLSTPSQTQTDVPSHLLTHRTSSRSPAPALDDIPDRHREGTKTRAAHAGARSRRSGGGGHCCCEVVVVWRAVKILGDSGSERASTRLTKRPGPTIRVREPLDTINVARTRKDMHASVRRARTTFLTSIPPRLPFLHPVVWSLSFLYEVLLITPYPPASGLSLRALARSRNALHPYL